MAPRVKVMAALMSMRSFASKVASLTELVRDRVTDLRLFGKVWTSEMKRSFFGLCI